MQYSIFTPVFTPTRDRTDDGKTIFSVHMAETHVKGKNPAEAMQNARMSVRVPIVGPRTK